MQQTHPNPQENKEIRNVQSEVKIDIERDSDQPYYNEVPPQNDIDVDYAQIKPKAMPGETGRFASIRYDIQCDVIEQASEDKVWAKTNFSSDTPIYVYTPKYRVALVRHVLEDKKINYVINDDKISNEDAKGKVLCHFYTRGLSIAQREFLVQKLKYGAEVGTLVEELENRFGYTEVRLLNSDFYLHKKSFSVLRSKHHTIPKRILDLIFVFLLAPIAIPIGLVTAALIKWETPGGVFFKQKRIGLFNKEYEVIKFRSMGADAEKSGAKWATKNDMRITKVGKIIRKTRIDELPQLINVFKGEMSMVGPRPEREVFINELEKEIPYYRFRHAVHPGVTGHAQVEYPYGASVDDAIWKHKYDMYYIKHQSLWMDLKILLKTVTTVLFGKGQ